MDEEKRIIGDLPRNQEIQIGFCLIVREIGKKVMVLIELFATLKKDTTDITNRKMKEERRKLHKNEIS